ncbi:MAG: serine/threonine protein kinase [Betaproteobacteria bacterium]|nr:serine/threonine protein kinase [Betaproteobacteria bacterium]
MTDRIDRDDTTAPPPYAGLTPDTVLDALDAAGFRSDGRLQALNSYENRVYQVYQDDAPPVVAKFYRPERWSDAQILEEHAFVAELADEEIPVVPALARDGQTLLQHAGFRFAVYPRRPGRAPELDGRDGGELRDWLGRFIARIHVVGARHAFAQRPSVSVQTFGTESRDYLAQHAQIPDDLLPAWRSTADDALAMVQQAYADAGAVRSLRLHGDCHLGNVLWVEGEGPHFVDFDDARNGPAMQDLWMLLAGERAAMTQQLGELLDGYAMFCDPDPHELRLIEPLRTLRILHYSAWLARRWADPAFPAAFPWFGTPKYWQDQILMLREQLSAMQEPPLVV